MSTEIRLIGRQIEHCRTTGGPSSICDCDVETKYDVTDALSADFVWEIHLRPKYAKIKLWYLGYANKLHSTQHRDVFLSLRAHYVHFRPFGGLRSFATSLVCPLSS